MLSITRSSPVYRVFQVQSSHHSSSRIAYGLPVSACGPSFQQFAARQVVSKELPEFAGDPIDWPLFVRSYNTSTRVYGYSDEKNLMRLQQCLKGSVKEAVRGRFYHPSSMPQVMPSLETPFSYPDLIVRFLMNKVYKTPAPKANKLESLIYFGLVFQNLYSQLQFMGGHGCPSFKPSLLREYEDKLPINIKLSWTLYQRQIPVAHLRTYGAYMTAILSAVSNVTLYAEPVRKQEKS